MASMPGGVEAKGLGRVSSRDATISFGLLFESEDSQYGVVFGEEIARWVISNEEREHRR